MPYPVAAVVGQSAVRRALPLLAVDPGLKGVLISGPPGSSKSLLARSFPSLNREKKFVELPLNVTEDHLLGGLDFERTLKEGKPVFSMGLLAQAHGGAVCVEDVNLLDAGLAGHLAAALDTGIVQIEREGLSAIVPAGFLLIGTYNPDEGEVAPALRERVGLLVEANPATAIDERMEIIRRVAEYEKDPAAFSRSCAEEMETIRTAIAQARARLAQIEIANEDIQRLSEIALSLGVAGNRADLFAVRAARASAALAGRDAVSEDDMIAAIQLVLIPRATVIPQTQRPTQDRPDATDSSERQHDEKQGEDDGGRQSALEDLLIQAVDAMPPKEALEVSGQKSGRSASGRRVEAMSMERGRYVRSATRRASGGKVAVDATLRAAAPFQAARRAGESPHKKRVRITTDDLRYKRFKRRSGMLFIFAVDASGSMALNRMAQAKGALTRLLQQAYLRRDKVALLSFRGERAETLLAPTRSVELAKRLVDAIPSGGATPVAVGLLRALEIARIARAQGQPQALVVLFTDGRANAGLRAAGAEAIRDELRQLGARLRTEGVRSVVIDTKSRFLAGGEGKALADLIGGRYVYLPRADADSVANAVTSIAREV